MGAFVHPAAVRAIAEAAMWPWRPIGTAPIETPIHVYGWNEVGPPERKGRYYFATVGSLDHGRRYAEDLLHPGCDCSSGQPMWNPERWAPFPEPPR